MFYLSDFEVKQTKEQEIRERVQRAEVDRLVQSIHPHRPGWLARSAHGAGHLLGQVLLGFGKRLEALGTSDPVSHRRRIA
jgi:hypothetical protein